MRREYRAGLFSASGTIDASALRGHVGRRLDAPSRTWECARSYEAKSCGRRSPSQSFSTTRGLCSIPTRACSGMPSIFTTRRKKYLADSLRHGPPFWTLFEYSGMPFLADPQVAAWYPLHWPFFLVGITPKAIEWELALHAFLALGGTYPARPQADRQRVGRSAGRRAVRGRRIFLGAQFTPRDLRNRGACAVALVGRRPRARIGDGWSAVPVWRDRRSGDSGGTLSDNVVRVLRVDPVPLYSAGLMAAGRGSGCGHGGCRNALERH